MMLLLRRVISLTLTRGVQLVQQHCSSQGLGVGFLRGPVQMQSTLSSSLQELCTGLLRTPVPMQSAAGQQLAGETCSQLAGSCQVGARRRGIDSCFGFLTSQEA